MTILESMKRLMFLVLLLLTLIGRIWGQEEDNKMAFTLKAIDGHVLEQAQLVGKYSHN